MSELLSNDPLLLQAYSRDAVYEGHPEAVCEARDFLDVSEVMKHCFAHKMPVTVCGSQTSMTGSSVADRGVSLSLKKMNRLLDVGCDSDGVPFAHVEPGLLLGDLKSAVEERGFFYPPDPTSYKEATAGASIATNATGSECFRFGPTRWYVQELEVLCADGVTKNLKRSTLLDSGEIKNRAGYFLNAEPIDQIIGSEGTLAIIKSAKLRLLPLSKPHRFQLVLPFSTFLNCMKAVRPLAEGSFNPRSLELIGPGAVSYFAECDRCPDSLKQGNCFLLVSDDFSDESEKYKKISGWFDFLQKLYSQLDEQACLEKIFLAETDYQLESIRLCRHYIPMRVHEVHFPFMKQGGGKVGTDWWVPLKHVESMMMTTYEKAQTLGIPFLVFAHIGNGHPHWNFLCRNPQEYKIAADFVKEQCRQVVLYGGGVAGEHGIGKIKKSLLALQLSQSELQQHYKIKKMWDPFGLLAPGNILD